jgi:hypothetical protein
MDRGKCSKSYDKRKENMQRKNKKGNWENSISNKNIISLHLKLKTWGQYVK